MTFSDRPRKLRSGYIAQFDQDLADKHRRIDGREIPFGECFKVRFLETLDEDCEFRDALRCYLIGEGAQ